MLVQSISQIKNNKIQSNNVRSNEISQKTVNNMKLPSFADAKSFVNINFKARIHECVRRGNWQDIRDELDKGVSINMYDLFGDTPLIKASIVGNADIAEKLLQQPEIDVNAQDMEGNTALIIAVSNGYSDVVEKLLQHPDIDVDIQDNYNSKAIDYASAKTAKMIKTYVPGVDRRNLSKGKISKDEVEDVNKPDKNGNTPLMRASIFKNMDKLDELLQNPEVDVNARGAIGCTALMCACNMGNGNAEVVEKLLQHPDINVNAQSSSGWTALHWACNRNYTKVVEKLLEHPDVDVNLKDDSDRSASFLANEEIAQMIKNYRRGVDKRDHSKMFPTTRSKWDKIQPQNIYGNNQEYEKFQQQLEKIRIDTANSVRKNETKKIREEERAAAQKDIADKMAELDKSKAEYEEKNKALDNLINDYQSILAEDISSERENLESNFRTLYGVKTDNLPDNMGFGEQMLYVVDILSKQKNKLSGVSANSPKNITKALQDNNGKISNDGLKFLDRMLQVSDKKCSEKDLIDSINAVKDDKGLLDMDKVSYFIASLSWGENRISDVIEDVRKYNSKEN